MHALGYCGTQGQCRGIILCWALLFSVIACGSASANTINVNPIADAWIELGHGQANVNNGTSTVWWWIAKRLTCNARSFFLT